MGIVYQGGGGGGVSAQSRKVDSTLITPPERFQTMALCLERVGMCKKVVFMPPGWVNAKGRRVGVWA